MATHHFATQINPALYIEIPDPDNPGQVIRPGAGLEVQVRDGRTGEALEPSAVDDYGYLTIETEDVPAIEVSITPEVWVGPIWSKEAQEASHEAGINAAEALTVAQEALIAAQAAQTGGGGSGGSGGPQILLEQPGQPGNYPPPTSAGSRWFVGTKEPTTSQGFREAAASYLDMWWPLIPGGA